MCESSLKESVRVDSDRFHRLGHRALLVAILNCCWMFTLFCILGAIIWFSLEFTGVAWEFGRIPWVPIVLGLFGWCLSLTVAGHFFRSYRLDELCLHSREGVLRYRHTVVPLNRVQHAEVFRGPFDRFVKLGTLLVHTAGPASSAVSIRYLDLDVANELLHEIVPQKSEQSEDVAETE